MIQKMGYKGYRYAGRKTDLGSKQFNRPLADYDAVVDIRVALIICFRV